MIECNNDEERRFRIERTLQRLVKASADLETLRDPPVTVALTPLGPRVSRPSASLLESRAEPSHSRESLPSS
jgi:hypothetical protein